MKVVQQYSFSALGNFSYLLATDENCWAVDPFDAQRVINWINDNKLKLAGIINTHDHWDHTKGNEELINYYGPCQVIVHKNSLKDIPFANTGIQEGENLFLDSTSRLTFVETPGHTENHICFYLIINEQKVGFFSGDTLFNAGVGNCKNGGNVYQLFETVFQRIRNSEDHIIVYPGHDYILNNLKFTLSVEPNNQVAKNLYTKLNQAQEEYCDYLTTIGEEKLINSFFRLQSQEIRQMLNLEDMSDKEVFVKLRSLRDIW